MPVGARSGLAAVAELSRSPDITDTLYLAAADATVVVHLFWILFLILGAWPGARHVWIRWTHLAALAFSILLQIFGWTCPLTILEAWLRQTGGTVPREGTFIGRYLERIVYPPLAPGLVLAGTVLIVGVSLWIYFGRRR